MARNIHTVTIRRGSVASPEVVDTGVRCAACRAYITVVRDGKGFYSECGGEGEGGCDAWIDGDTAAEQTHSDAIARVEALTR